MKYNKYYADSKLGQCIDYCRMGYESEAVKLLEERIKDVPNYVVSSNIYNDGDKDVGPVQNIWIT